MKLLNKATICMKLILDLPGSDINLRLLGHHTNDCCTLSEGRQMGCGPYASFSFMDYLFKLFWNQHYKDSLKLNLLSALSFFYLYTLAFTVINLRFTLMNVPSKRKP